MDKVLKVKLGRVRFRCSLNILLEYAARILIAGGVLAAAAVAVERLVAVDVVSYWSAWAFGAAVAVMTVAFWLLNHPSRMSAALLLDERLKLKERFSTALALGSSDDAFARAACGQARRTAERIKPQQQFPVRPSRNWVYAGGTWAIVAAMVMFMPQKDLLGLLARKEKEKARTKEVETAKSQVAETAKVVKTTLDALGQEKLAEELAALNQVPEGARAEDIKRQAIKKLGDISEKLKQMQNQTKFESMQVLQQMLKQLPGSPDAVSQQLRMALARGQFGKAAALLKQMQQELSEGKLSQEQQKALAQKLQELAKQLQQLAAENKKLEDELEKLGLDKKLAKLNQQQLRKALQKQGLSQQQIEQLLRKAAACRMACSRCSGLGQAMAACGVGGSLGGDQLADAAEQLSQLESLQEQLKLTEAALAQIEGACKGMGRGMCKGIGCRKPFASGQSNRYGPGTGGPGKGFGPRGYDDSGKTGTKTTKVKNKPGEGPIIASWYFKGPQVKGEARRDLAEVLRAGRDSAAEAISDNEIPRRYEGAVKNYFGRLEKSGGQ